MNTDFRIEVGFFDHHKTRRLIASLGIEAAWSLLRLWEFAVVNKPDGSLSGMTDEDIAAAAHYPGDPGAFVAELRRLRWVVNGRRSTLLHDWKFHQPFAINAPRRREKAKKAAEARWNRTNHADATSMLREQASIAQSNAPAFLAFLPEKNPPNPPQAGGRAAIRESADAAPSAAPPDGPRAVLEFPCRGIGPKLWPLTAAKLAAWGEAYPGVAVEAECRKALAWLTANGPKTAQGMERFLVRWLNRASDAGRGPGGGASGRRLGLAERNELATAGWENQP